MVVGRQIGQVAQVQGPYLTLARILFHCFVNDAVLPLILATKAEALAMEAVLPAVWCCPAGCWAVGGWAVWCCSAGCLVLSRRLAVGHSQTSHLANSENLPFRAILDSVDTRTQNNPRLS